MSIVNCVLVNRSSHFFHASIETLIVIKDTLSSVLVVIYTCSWNSGRLQLATFASM